MSNMSYCRFRNTLADLIACRDALDEIGGNLAELSKDEAKAADALIRVCQYIAAGFDDMSGHQP